MQSWINRNVKIEKQTNNCISHLISVNKYEISRSWKKFEIILYMKTEICKLGLLEIFSTKKCDKVFLIVYVA